MLKGEGDYVQRERNNLLVGLTSMNKFVSMPEGGRKSKGWNFCLMTSGY